MADLRERKYRIGQFVWVKLLGKQYHGRIVGYEDGRKLRVENYVDQWVYYVRMPDGEWKRFVEGKLRAVEEVKI